MAPKTPYGWVNTLVRGFPYTPELDFTNNPRIAQVIQSSPIPTHPPHYKFNLSRSKVIPVEAPRLEMPPSATIDKVWVDYDVVQDGQKGLRIHIAFGVSNLLGHSGLAAAYFFFVNGKALPALHRAYAAQDGNVCVPGLFAPKSMPRSYPDFILFMPYGELHVATGRHNLKFVALIWDDRGRMLAKSKWHFFTYTAM